MCDSGKRSSLLQVGKKVWVKTQIELLNCFDTKLNKRTSSVPGNETNIDLFFFEKMKMIEKTENYKLLEFLSSSGASTVKLFTVVINSVE